MRHVYNRAKLLNVRRRLAMSVLQRPWPVPRTRCCDPSSAGSTSSTDLIRRCRRQLTEEQLVVLQRRLAEEDDVLDTKTADEESIEDGAKKVKSAKSACWLASSPLR